MSIFALWATCFLFQVSQFGYLFRCRAPLDQGTAGSPYNLKCKGLYRAIIESNARSANVHMKKTAKLYTVWIGSYKDANRGNRRKQQNSMVSSLMCSLNPNTVRSLFWKDQPLPWKILLQYNTIQFISHLRPPAHNIYI